MNRRFVPVHDLSLQGSLAAGGDRFWWREGSLPHERVRWGDLPCLYFSRTRKLFLSGMISILSSRASHPRPKLKSSPR